MWSAKWIERFSNGSGMTKAAIFNPRDMTFSQYTVTDNQHDMFCPGISMMGNGNIIVTGGNNAEKATMYTVENGWQGAQDMKISRGYHSSCTLGSGEVRLFSLTPLPKY